MTVHCTDAFGRIERIVQKTGAHVKKDELLMELSNPKLKQTLDETKWELQALESQAKAQLLPLKSQLFDQEIAVIN